MPLRRVADANAPRTPPKSPRVAGEPRPRGTTFELFKQTRGRWQLDAVYDDKGLAVEEAKAFLGRAREQVAVRVVAVEPRDTDFLEWIVFRGASGVRGKNGVAAKPGDSKITTNTAVVARGVRRGAGPRKHLSLAKAWRSPRVTLIAALAVLAMLFAYLNYRNSQTHPWAFDSPDAQKAHAVRTPWAQ